VESITGHYRGTHTELTVTPTLGRLRYIVQEYNQYGLDGHKYRVYTLDAPGILAKIRSAGCTRVVPRYVELPHGI
jgi:hypothetical protein